MQDWDTRIKDLKISIQNAREKFVIPQLNLQKSFIETPIKTQEISEPVQDDKVTEVISSETKVYENKNPLSSLDLLNKAENGSKEVSNLETKLGLTEEISVKLDNISEDLPKVEITEEIPTKLETEIEEPPKIEITEDKALELEPQSIDPIKEDLINDTLEKQDENSSELQLEVLDDNIVKKTELELLEEKNEDDLTEDEEDRMMELRLLRAQKTMNKEANDKVKSELKKADEEIADLESQLKPKPKNLPKGYIS
jgi:hypothetical protein